MSSKSYLQAKKVAALAILMAFLSTGAAALPVFAAPTASATNAAVNSTVNASIVISPDVISAGGTVNIAIKVDAQPAVALKAAVTQPDGTTYFAWYNFTTTSGTLYQIYPTSSAPTVQSPNGTVSAFKVAPFETGSPSTTEVGVYQVAILDYNLITGQSHAIAQLKFYVENGLIVKVTTNANTAVTAVQRNQPFTINAALYYISNGAPVNTATMSAIATVTSQTNPTQSFTFALQKTGSVPQFTGTFTAFCNDTGAWTVSVEGADGLGNYGVNSTVAHVNTTTLNVAASVNGVKFQRTQTVTINAHVTEPNGAVVTSGQVSATLYPAGSNAATSITIPLSYSSATSSWTGTWAIPYNYPIGSYYFKVNAADSCVAPDTGVANTGDFSIIPAQIVLHLTVTPTTGERGTSFAFAATGTWPNGIPFTNLNFGTDIGSVTLFNNVTYKPISLTYSASTGQWTGEFPTCWNTATGHYNFWAAASDQFGNGGTSNSQIIDVIPVTLTVKPWGVEVIRGNSNSAVLYINFNVTYPSDLVSCASGRLGYIPLKDIPGHIDAYILYNGQVIRNGYNWYYNWSLSTKGTAVYTLYTVENAAAFQSWYSSPSASESGIGKPESGTVKGWPLGSGYPNATFLGNYTIEVTFADNASAPNTGHGANSFPVAKVLTTQTSSVSQSVKDNVTATAYVYTAGTWTTPAVNSKLLPSSIQITETGINGPASGHTYTYTLNKLNAATGKYGGSLSVDKAEMYAGKYLTSEVLLFPNMNFVEPYILDNNVALLTVNGDLKIYLTRPYNTYNNTPVVYKPNSWYSVNGTVTDNYGHPVEGLKLLLIQSNLSEYQYLVTTSTGSIIPAPNTGYVMVIPADAPTGEYPITIKLNGTAPYYKAVEPFTHLPYFKVSKVVSMPSLSVSASVTPSTIDNGTSGTLVAVVTSNGQPVSGATVTATLIQPTGATSKLTLLPGTVAGTYQVPINIPSTATSGTYTVQVSASKAGYVTGTGSATFYVQVVTPAPPAPPPSLSIALSVSPSSLSNGTSGVISAQVTSNGQPVSGATVTGQLISPSGATQSLTFMPTASTAGLYTAQISIPSSGPAGTWTVTASASAAGYKSTSGGTSFAVTIVTPPVIPKPTPVDLTYVYLLAGLAAIFALIALIYIAIKLK
jgi:hypothetical protein